jgi:dihydroneopterin aldolase/2-amino-4-hydroxy-6-hydroxymethyldihydropteridine diphosphokinase
MGDKKMYLDTAVSALCANPLCRDVRVSEYIVTEPVGGVEQDDFLNAAVEVRTIMTPHELLNFSNKLEQQANRVREIHWGPRTLDIDLLLYDDEVICDTRLIVPHIEMHKRRFVLEPLCELNPYIVHPLLGKTAMQLLDELK